MCAKWIPGPFHRANDDLIGDGQLADCSLHN